MKVAKELYMYLLGAIVILCAFFLGYLLATNEIPGGNKDVVMVAVGVILGWGSMVVGYFFGSSKSSADKNEMLSNKPNE
jgi:hypothetical protein